MILAVLLMMQASPPPAPVPDDTITVVARKLQEFRATLGRSRKGTTCSVRKSTGDVDVDRIGCEAVVTCYPQFQSRLAGSNDRAIQSGTRKVMQSALNAELAQCVASVQARMATDLAERRKGA